MGQNESLFTRVGPTRFMYYLGKHLPPPLGYLVVLTVTRLIIWKKPSIYRAAYHNLAHVLPPETSETELRRTVHRLVYHSVLGYYHLFHNLGWGRGRGDQTRPRVKMAPDVRQYIAQATASGRGLLVLGTHTSNYDLCGIALSHMLPSPPQALSIANPASGHKFVNRLRVRVGRGSVTPVSPENLRAAVQRLRAGGIVFTGVDRPVYAGNHPVTFFGKTASLPVGYIRIALMADCLAMTMAFRWDGHAYWIHGNPPMRMERTGDRHRDLELNLRRVLAQVEDFVRAAPDQWTVFVPVWP